jgi:hypothetical protein
MAIVAGVATLESLHCHTIRVIDTDLLWEEHRENSFVGHCIFTCRHDYDWE